MSSSPEGTGRYFEIKSSLRIIMSFQPSPNQEGNFRVFVCLYWCVCICIYVFIFVFVCCETLFSTTHTALMPAVPASLSTELQTSWLPHYCFQQCRVRFLFCIFIFSTFPQKYLAGNSPKQFPPPRGGFSGLWPAGAVCTFFSIVCTDSAAEHIAEQCTYICVLLPKCTFANGTFAQLALESAQLGAHHVLI